MSTAEPPPHHQRNENELSQSRPADLAETLLGLHVPGDPVVLPTVWDVWSAEVAADAGFPALTVGSKPLAHSLGKTDHEGMRFTDVLDRVAAIVAAVQLPVSVDAESGYGLSPEEMISGVLEAGAVGLNIEDTVHSDGGRLRSSAELADLVAALRTAADSCGVHVVINARTDVILHQLGEESDRVDRAIARLREAAAAGADCLYPIGLHDNNTHRRLATELPLPVNAVVRPDEADVTALAALGVARISFGPFLQTALTARATDILKPWSPRARG